MLNACIGMIPLLFCCLSISRGLSAAELWTRGFPVIPTPRNVTMSGPDILLTSALSLTASTVSRDHIATRTLIHDMNEFHGIQFGGAAGLAVHLGIEPDTIKAAAEPEVLKQAYRLRIGPDKIEIIANGDPGLLYGVNTLVQLVRRDSAGRLWLPAATIEDWPSFQLRFLHWDSKHHQDRMETLKRYLDWSARMKVNMIGFELEDKFEYPSNPIIGAPGAFTSKQLQEIVNYGLERFIQVVPVIQSPSHMAYVLKHEKFADLRDDGNNYQIAMCDPRAYDLIFSMYDDVINATRGVNYLFVSTDEMYYAGIGKNCDEPYTPENRSLRWVKFVQRAETFVSSKGRKMLVWAEYPLLPQHAQLLPKGIIDGVVGEAGYLEAEKKLGIRQLAYNSLQGGEFLFPNHLSLESDRGPIRGRLEAVERSIASGKHMQGNPIGVFGAAWDDSGLHNETFWLGWSAIAQYGWQNGTPPVDQHVAAFMSLYYGPGATGMTGIYRRLQRQARGWERSWDRVVSKTRRPGYGNSYGKGIGTTRYDLTLTPPSIPKVPDLAGEAAFTKRYEKVLNDAKTLTLENDLLIEALQANMPRVDRNRYNLEVLLSLANFTGRRWGLLLALADAEHSFEQAHEAHEKKNAARAVGHLVTAHNAVARAQSESAATFKNLTAVFEKSRFPKGQSVGGKQFVHVLDDTKDHWADRRPDLSFMAAPEQSIELGRWLSALSTAIREYAKQQNVPVKGLGEVRLEE